MPMPRVEEVQLVHWGTLRPDPIPLLVGGVNVITGPNGSGKTCFLDAIKVLLGVTDLAGGRSPAGYVFDGAGSGAAAERAFLRATFAHGGHGGRPFSAAGPELADADRVSVVCLVSVEGRRYRVVPGRLRWGVERPIEVDLQAFLEDNPPDVWLGPRSYADLLCQSGMSRALRAVLALPQGAIDRLVDEPPPALLRKLLELTGRQGPLDALRAARERLDGARAACLAAAEQERAERATLARLERLADRHVEWVTVSERLQRLEQVLLPAAGHRDLSDELGSARVLRDRLAARAGADQERLVALAEQVPAIGQEVQALAEQAAALEQELDEVVEELQALDGRVAGLDMRLAETEVAAARAASLAGQRTPETAKAELTTAERALTAALRREADLRADLDRRQAEVAALRTGAAVPPAEVGAFRERLAAAGIPAQLVADLVDLPEDADDAARVMAEAALGDALWALVVASEQYRDATVLAAETGYRHGIVRTGAGEPTGVLAKLVAPVELGLLLERTDALAAADARQAHQLATRGRTAVDADGMRYADAVSRLQAPPSPVLGRAARAARLAAAEAELERLRGGLAEAAATIPDRRVAFSRAVRVLDAARSVADLEQRRAAAERAVRDLHARRPELIDRRHKLRRELRAVDEQRGARAAELAAARDRQGRLEARLASTLPRLAEAEGRAAQLETDLAARELTEEQQAVLARGHLTGTESLVHDRDWLAREVADPDRFGPEVRDPTVLGRRDEQARAVEAAEANLARRNQEADGLAGRVEDAGTRYDEHARNTVRLLSTHFAHVCQLVGAEGELRLVPGERPEAHGVEALLAHRPGEPRRPAQDTAHSGGQRARIALLLLLATASIDGAADLLVMDEHIAHLDSVTIDQVAELMRRLQDHTQFILAIPTNAEALRLAWCDLQLAFLPRGPADPYSPPIRLLSRLGTSALARQPGSAPSTPAPT